MVMLGKMDLIFCRNVIIYFDLAAKKRVVESFFNTLSEGGYLLLGHSESLMNVTTRFTLRHFKNDMIYQKPEHTAGVRP
jgi:chemotaxis protein methyltransferase CheR